MDHIWENMLLLDRMNDFSQPDPMYAFALDELLCRGAGTGGPAICHLWRHPHGFVLGLKDSRMPHAEAARRWLEASGWLTIVRNSGGAAVPLDAGVVNISLILPKTNAMDFHFHHDFERMYELIAGALGEAERLVAKNKVAGALHEANRLVAKGEIAGAYCPGDYDLSIDGYKFCGIAQRRQTHASIVQAFVVAGGSGRARAELVRSFYDIASGGDDSLGHPVVTGDSTASLEETAGLGAQAAATFASAVKSLIRGKQSVEGMASASSRLRMPEPERIAGMIASLRSRYSEQTP